MLQLCGRFLLFFSYTPSRQVSKSFIICLLYRKKITVIQLKAGKTPLKSTETKWYRIVSKNENQFKLTRLNPMKDQLGTSVLNHLILKSFRSFCQDSNSLGRGKRFLKSVTSKSGYHRVVWFSWLSVARRLCSGEPVAVSGSRASDSAHVCTCSPFVYLWWFQRSSSRFTDAQICSWKKKCSALQLQ